MRLMKHGPARRGKALYAPGRTVGWQDDGRPEDLRGFDRAALKLKQDSLRQRAAKLSGEDCQELFAFYWSDLPRDGWRGDSLVRREATVALDSIWSEVRGGKNDEVAALLLSEAIKRLDAHDPDAIARSLCAYCVARFAARDDANALTSLERTRARECPPRVRISIEDEMGKINSASTPAPFPREVFDAVQDRYRREANSFRSRIFGMPRDLRPVDEYKADLAERLRERMTPDVVSSLAEDYRRHAGDRPADLLIRRKVNAALEGAVQGRVLDEPTRRALQRSVLEIIGLPEPEAVLRLWALGALRWTGIDCLPANEVLAVIETRMAIEKVYEIKANLEYWRLRITDPAALDDSALLELDGLRRSAPAFAP